MIAAYRLCKTRHLASAFTGEGAKIHGGRWNSPGIAVVYAASSLSLATLEVLVHLEDPEAFARLFSWIPLEIPENLIEEIEREFLPYDWFGDESHASTQAVGDAWLKSMRSPVLAVPSVVTPTEWNFLLNPAHRKFNDIKIGEATAFRPDPRLVGWK